MAIFIHHTADSRGHARHGWLDSYHTFSFAQYYDPERIHFGALRVLNDDTVSAGMGFGTHPHENMEIISIPLEGDLEHKDSMGNIAVIRQGDIQVMSAGTGIYHSEYNKNKDREVRFLQIWVFPDKQNVTPRYGQVTLEPESLRNRFQMIVSPKDGDGSLWIHQSAWFHLGQFDKGWQTAYSINKPGNGLYIFMLEGSIRVEGNTMNRRDGLGITGFDQLNIEVLEDAKILTMEVPMEF